MTISQNSFVNEKKTQAQGAHDGKSVRLKSPMPGGFTGIKPV